MNVNQKIRNDNITYLLYRNYFILLYFLVIYKKPSILDNAKNFELYFLVIRVTTRLQNVRTFGPFN